MSVLKVQPREDVAAKHLRKKGYVPVAYIDHEKSIQNLMAAAHHIKQAITHSQGAGMIEVEFEGEKKKRNAIVKSYDQKILTRDLLSVTLMEVSLDESITADITVHGVGTPEAVEEGTAVLNSPTSTIKIKGKVKDIPETIEVDLTGLAVGGHVNAGDIELPEGMTLMSSPDATLFSVQIAKEEVLEEPTEAAEPELVSEEPAGESE